MLYITYKIEKDEKGNKNEYVSWEVGGPSKFFPLRKVIEVQADGLELEYIKVRFNTTGGFTIPIAPSAKIMFWYGDIAKTIVANLI